jgi:hypothetical protein
MSNVTCAAIGPTRPAAHLGLVSVGQAGQHALAPRVDRDRLGVALVPVVSHGFAMPASSAMRCAKEMPWRSRPRTAVV